MKSSYVVFEDYEEYSALGGVEVDMHTPLAVFTSKKLAINYCKKYSHPQHLNNFPPLGYGHLSVVKMPTNTKTPVTKLPGYKGANDLKE